ncbi:MAG: DNA primase [Oscillospiraceae bacterium]|nr:DNA primase [Candidatus Ruminococcus equi]
MRLSDDFISEVKYRNDLSDIASGYMTLKRRGRNLVGLCPFHGEKTPSFNIYTENGSFYCFGCGVGGDVITFIMKIENLDYIEAVKFLAQRAGMSMPEESFDDSLSKLRTRVFEANREAARFFYAGLYTKEGENALSYLRSRALKESTIRHFGLGFAPDSRFALTNHLKSKGFTDAELIAANLVFKTRSGNGVVDRFYNRVMFPIIDLRGNVIAFGGRIMTDQKPKYLNTSDTVVFSKSNNLFSLNNAKNAGSKSLILCEGYMDVIAINQAGFQNAVATLGTALTTEQAILMKRYCDEVIICYDSDEAGQKATARAIPILRNAGLVVRVLNIPDGKDPDEFIRKNGDNGTAAFKNILENTGNDIDYRLYKLRSNFDMNTTQGKLSYLSEAIKLLSSLDNAVEQDVYASKLAEEVNVEKSSIIEQVKKANKKTYVTRRKKEFSNLQKEISARDDVINPQRKEKIRASTAEENLIAFLVNNPDKLPYIEKRIQAEDFVTDFNRKLYVYFFDRIKNSKEPLTTVSADFTSDEVSKIYKIVTSYHSVSGTMTALDEYIKIIKDESSKPSQEDIKSASDEQMKDFFKNLRESHQ